MFFLQNPQNFKFNDTWAAEPIANIFTWIFSFFSGHRMFSNIAFGKIKIGKRQIWQQNTENHKHLFAVLMSKQTEKPLKAESYRTLFSPNTEHLIPLSPHHFLPYYSHCSSNCERMFQTHPSVNNQFLSCKLGLRNRVLHLKKCLCWVLCRKPEHRFTDTLYTDTIAQFKAS